MSLPHRSSVRLVALLSLALASLAASSRPARAQGVLVAPQGIPIDHRVRSASFEVYNPGTERTEVAVSTLFGYPVSDSTGRTTLFTTESPDAAAPSAASWIAAYPRRLVLGPGERQTIRLFARPPQNLPDGEYWTRIVVSARAAVAEPAAADSGVRAGLSLEVRTIIAAWYRKGALATGLTVDSARAEVRGDTVALRPFLTRTGGAAYIGTIRATLEDSTGRRLDGMESQLAVYRALSPRLVVRAGAAPLAPGRYRLRLTIDDAREDLRRDAIVPGPAVAHVVEMTVPAPRAGGMP